MQAVGAAQVETREVLETVIHRLERLETSPVPKFVATRLSLEARQSKPKVDYRQVALQTRWPILV